jgi:hypothetical protein
MKRTEDKFLDLKGLAEYSSLAVPTIRDYLKSVNPIPHFKIKGKILVKQSEFDAWLEGFRVTGDALAALVDDVRGGLNDRES